MKKLFIVLLLLVLGLGLFSVVQKVPDPSPENLYQVEGIVERVHSPCCQDVVIQLAGSEKIFYINRGLEGGIDMDAWNESLKGVQVTLQVIRHHSLLGRNNAPVAEIASGEKVFFSRL